MELEKLALEMFGKLFTQNPDVKTFKASKLRYLEAEPLRFVEQNPEKPSKFAKLAREGHKVMWVINYKTNKYVASVIDGTFQLT